MSISIDYFFNDTLPLPALAPEINRCLGSSLSNSEDDPDVYFARFLSMDLSLETVDYENDRNIPFESYRYKIGFRTAWADAQTRVVQLAAMTIVIFCLHNARSISGILVYDMQCLLAQYIEREIPSCGKSLYDLLSQTAFVDFDVHLSHLQQRIATL